MRILKAFCFVFLLPTVAHADVPAMMNKIVGLRAELETANRELESDLKARQSELDLWTQKRLELEGQLQKERLRQLQLEEKTKRLAMRVKTEGKADPKAKASLIGWLNQADAWVRSSLPFRRPARLETIQKLKERAERGLESPESLSSELWQFYESEMKLALDNDYRILEVENVGKAEVARLGLYTLFAKSTEGSVYQAVLDERGWSMKPIGPEAKRDAERLIQNLKSKKEQGLYSIPLAQPGHVSKETL